MAPHDFIERFSDRHGPPPHDFVASPEALYAISQLQVVCQCITPR
ncbi:hypothetical protein THIARS_50251 [Thiomonas delicata]|uniref:Uncharacterized protein n=1 Tax=Thiomonas delicata TaxID=364030 RepID=A0A238D168_THIDL|nr:hypothetical protein THIARS_50251 [Thiomonas delicata]